MNFKKFDYQYLEYDFYRAFLLLCKLWKEKHKTTTPQCQWYNLPLAVNDPSKLFLRDLMSSTMGRQLMTQEPVYWNQPHSSLGVAA